MRKFVAALCATLAVLWAAKTFPARAQESAPPSTQPKPLSAETFLELRTVQDPQFSPDGTRVANRFQQRRRSAWSSRD